MYNSIAGLEVDLFINTGSLQEIPKQAVEAYFDIIQNRMNVKHIYSFNYFLNVRRLLLEWKAADEGTESLNICPVLDANWSVLNFRINPPHLTVDCCGRNWLETLLVRGYGSDAEELFEKDATLPELSDEWFANIWMAIWKRPAPRYIKEMLRGLEIFSEGNLRPKYMFSGQYGAPLSPSATLDQKRQAGLLMEEVSFYRQQLDR